MMRYLSLWVCLAACAGKAPPESPTPASGAPSPWESAPGTEPAPGAGPQPVAPATPAPPASAKGPSVEDAVGLLGRDSGVDDRAALELLTRLASAENPDAVVLSNLGVAQYRTGDPRAAEATWKKAIEKDRGAGAAWAGLAVSALEAGRWNESVATARSGVAAAPDNTAVRVALIEALRRSGDTAGAVAEARAALLQDAFALPVHNAMGLAYLGQGELALARFVFEKALGSVPGADKDAEIRANLGRVYLASGDRLLARAAFTEALALDDRNLPSQVQLGRMLVQDHAYAQALPLLERATAADSSQSGVWVDLAIAQRGVNQLAAAETSYRKALATNPSDPAPLLNLAILFGDYNKDYSAGQNAAQDYVKAGGPLADQAKELMDDLKREARDADRRRKAEEDKRDKDSQRQKDSTPVEAPPPEAPPTEAPPEPTPSETPPPTEGEVVPP